MVISINDNRFDRFDNDNGGDSEGNMTTQEAILILINDMPANEEQSEAWRIAAVALYEQAKRDDPHPLTLEELRERDGKPVWVVDLEELSYTGWYLCYWDRGKYFLSDE